MGWSWSLFGVVIVRRLELGVEKGQNRHTVELRENLDILGTFLKPKTKGEGERTGPDRRLPPIF